jgi:ribonucleoside-diphosphate reductase beta chain
MNSESMVGNNYMNNYAIHADDFINTIVDEPLLMEENFRYTVLPINPKYTDIWRNYKTQLKIHWVVEEIDLSKDLESWNLLDPDTKNFISYVLAFFAAADGIVNANIKTNLIDLVKIKEAECAYGKQFEMECAHGEMYSLMLDTFIKDDVEKNRLINSVVSMESIKEKAEWCEKWIESDYTFAHKLVVFSIVEGIFFSGSFASIFWLKTFPGVVMPGLLKSNRFIARDERQHVDLACIIYHHLRNKLKESVVYEIMDMAIAIEKKFIEDSLPNRLSGINSDIMNQYVRYVADRLLVQLGYNKKYMDTNPLEYMEKIDLYCKVNFFEERNDTYADSKIDNNTIWPKPEEYRA